MSMRLRAIVVVLAMVVLGVVATGTSAVATQPGRNGLITFQIESSAGSEIYVLDPNTGGVKQVTHLGDATTPDWSPDGQWIAFSLHECHVALIRPDGTDLHRIPSRSPRGCETDPAFTPDGRHLVYERYDAVHDDDAIWIMRTDGGGRHRLGTGPNGGAATPEVSPDGHSVTFLSWDREDLTAIYGVSIDGGAVWRVTPDLWGITFKHDWAPDGSRLVMSDNADDTTRTVNLLTIRADGTGLRYLTDLRTPDQRAFAGSYSPDGQWIVYREESGDLSALKVVRTDGTSVQTLLPFSDVRPRFIDWGPATT
jgi:Tol biopolymer transport system component